MMTAEQLTGEHTLSGLLRDYCSEQVREDIKVSGLALDSRKVQAGDLFLAVAGTQTHGLEHARQAIALGAVAIAWEPVEGNSALAESAALLPAPTIAVPGLSHVVGLIADRYYGHPSRGMFTIGITGTDGKTSCSAPRWAALYRTMKTSKISSRAITGKNERRWPDSIRCLTLP